MSLQAILIWWHSLFKEQKTKLTSNRVPLRGSVEFVNTAIDVSSPSLAPRKISKNLDSAVSHIALFTEIFKPGCLSESSLLPEAIFTDMKFKTHMIQIFTRDDSFIVIFTSS